MVNIGNCKPYIMHVARHVTSQDVCPNSGQVSIPDGRRRHPARGQANGKARSKFTGIGLSHIVSTFSAT
eukprot:scaffold99130_cov42-Prasinocladus_malaysianus.AAC.2